MVMNNRKYTGTAGTYRFGFQKQEIDNEFWNGAASFKYRMNDSRLGRFFSLDPLAKKFAYNSPYVFSENRVVDGIELEGAEVLLIGFGGGGNVVLGGGGEGGIAIGPDGAFGYGSLGIGVATNVGGAGYLSITYFGNMPTVQDASGIGYSYGTSGGEGMTYGTNVSISSGFYGVNYQIGYGGSELVFQGQGQVSYTWLTKEIRSYQDKAYIFNKAKNFITEKLKDNNKQIQSLKLRNENLIDENRELTKQLENSSNNEQSQYIDSQIDKNAAEYSKNSQAMEALATENINLSNLSKVIDEKLKEEKK